MKLFRKKRFNEPLNTAVFTTMHIIEEGSPIIWISHELDGDWVFTGDEYITDYRKVGRLVSLEEIIKLDRSVLKVAHMPIGYAATRNTKADKWKIGKIEYTAQEMAEFGYYCSNCGVYHKEVPMAYGTDAPLPYYLVPEDDRERRCALSGDQCIIDDSYYYIRGIIELAVEDSDDRFVWNVWVEISKDDFYRIEELWEDENRILEPQYDGEIATQLEPYPQTVGLKVKVITSKVGFAPIIVLQESGHPLCFEQQDGITMDRVIAFADAIIYRR